MVLHCYICEKRIVIEKEAYLALHEYPGDLRFCHSRCYREEIKNELRQVAATSQEFTTKAR